MSRRFTGVIVRSERWYVAHCVELGVVSQGKTIEEAKANLQEAVELYLECSEEETPESTTDVLLFPFEVDDAPEVAFSG